MTLNNTQIIKYKSMYKLNQNYNKILFYGLYEKFVFYLIYLGENGIIGILENVSFLQLNLS